MSISYRRLIKPKSIEFHFEVIVLVLDNKKEILSLTKIFVIVIVNRKKTGREGSIICRFSIITFVWFDLEIGMVTQMGSSMFLWGGVNHVPHPKSCGTPTTISDLVGLYGSKYTDSDLPTAPRSATKFGAISRHGYGKVSATRSPTPPPH